MGDFTVTNATTVTGDRIDVRVKNGLIASVKPAGTLDDMSNPARSFDADGRFVTPSLSEPHIHLDYALAAGEPQWNSVGTLAEGIDIWGAYKENISKADVKQRSTRAAEWLVANGVTRVRTHADASEESLSTVSGLLEVQEELADIIDIEVVAFPQDGLFTSKGDEDLFRDAIEMGVDAVGAIPHVEPTREMGVKSVKTALDIATEHGLKADLHIDETDDPGSRYTEVLAHEARERNIGDRTTASHATALHSYPNAHANKVISLLADSGVSVVTNPPDNSVLQGRYDDYPRRRGHTRIDQLHDAGITVGLGHDSVMDPWYHYGKADPLDAAYVLIHYAHMNGYDDVATIWQMLTDANAEVFGVEEYGLQQGNEGSLVVYDSSDAFNTLRTRPPRRLVLKEGEPVAQTEPSETTVFRSNKDRSVDFMS